MAHADCENINVIQFTDCLNVSNNMFLATNLSDSRFTLFEIYSYCESWSGTKKYLTSFHNWKLSLPLDDIFRSKNEYFYQMAIFDFMSMENCEDREIHNPKNYSIEV